MSVDSVDRSNQLEYRKQSEEYENELAARHRKELAEISKRHQRDVEKIRKEYSDTINDLRHNSTEAISDRDRRHIKDVQGIQEMNRKFLTRVKGEDEEKYDRTKDNLEGQVAQAKDKDEYDQKRLSEKFERDLSEKDANDREMEKSYREGSHEAYETQSKRLNEKDEKDKEFLQDRINENKSKSDRELTETRRDRDQKVSNLKMRMEDQRAALKERYKNDLQQEQSRYEGHLANMREGFAEEIAQNKNKYRSRGEGLADEYAKNYDRLKDSTNDRVDKQVDSVKRENQFLQDKVVMGKEKDKIQNSIENDHLIGEYQKREDELEFRREKAADMAHKEKSKDLYSLQRKNDRLIEKRNQEFAGKYSDLKRLNDENLDKTAGQAYRDRDFTKMQTDLQKKRVIETYAEKTNDQAEFYEDALDGKQKNYEKLLSEQLASADKGKNEDLGVLQSQLAKENIDHKEKLLETMSAYDKDISQMRNDYEKRMRHQAELFREQTDKQVKSMQADREAGEAKLQARLAQTKEFYEKEMDQLRKRQVAERQEIAMKKNS